MLEQQALTYLPADDHTLPNHTPLVTVSWQAVEGVELGETESEPFLFVDVVAMTT